MTADWQQFSFADKDGTAPPPGELVWIAPASDYGPPVTVGHFDGFTFRDSDGYDDLRVTHWARINYPAPPMEGPTPGGCRPLGHREATGKCPACGQPAPEGSRP